MTRERRETLSSVADRIEDIWVAHSVRLAIDGRTATGKTTLADEMAVELRARGRIVIQTSVDGSHGPSAERSRRRRLSAEGYLDDARCSIGRGARGGLAKHATVGALGASFRA